jgi:hypothetical protein
MGLHGLLHGMLYLNRFDKEPMNRKLEDKPHTADI